MPDLVNFTNTRMMSIFLKSLVFSVVIGTLSVVSFAQPDDRSKGNNPYTPSPASRSKVVESSSQTKVVLVKTIASNDRGGQTVSPQAIANETMTVAKRASSESVPPTSVYHLDSGDVVKIEIRNGSVNSGFFTVRGDGTIDFPLAGENVIVAGQTIAEVESFLSQSIKLFEKPKVTAKIVSYVSHPVFVSGLVEAPGSQQIQRDAVPLFVIQAAAMVNPRAVGVKITRDQNSKVETYLLAGTSSESVLVFPGDSVEFTGGTDASTIGYYFISGEITAGGKRDLSAGLTLTQAIVASGGVRNNAKKARVRRRNDSGAMVTLEYELKGINAGKTPDPTLNQGDIVEIAK